MPNWGSDIADNPMVKWAVIAGVLTILAGIAFFTDVSAGLTDAVGLIADLFMLIVILYLFGRKGPLGGN